MPSQWAASGARLSLTVDVRFGEQSVQPSAAERLLGPIDGSRVLSPLADTSFVGAQGTTAVPIVPGAWRATSTPEVEGLGSNVRWYLDFPSGAMRNDVDLPAGRVFFTSAVWDADALREAELEAAQLLKEVEEQRESAREVAQTITGGPIARARAVREAVLAKDELDRLQRRLKDRSSGLPDQGSVCAGPRGLVLAGEGLLCVKRAGGPLGMSDVYHIVGKFRVDRSLDEAGGAGSEHTRGDDRTDERTASALRLRGGQSSGSNSDSGQRLTREEIVAKLNRVPTFTIVDQGGEYVPLSSTDDGEAEIVFFIDVDAAEARGGALTFALTLVLRPHPHVWPLHPHRRYS